MVCMVYINEHFKILANFQAVISQYVSCCCSISGCSIACYITFLPSTELSFLITKNFEEPPTILDTAAENDENRMQKTSLFNTIPHHSIIPMDWPACFTHHD
jgi:hypothetical protein